MEHSTSIEMPLSEGFRHVNDYILGTHNLPWIALKEFKVIAKPLKFSLKWLKAPSHGYPSSVFFKN